jgi:hypothetical protein
LSVLSLGLVALQWAASSSRGLIRWRQAAMPPHAASIERLRLLRLQFKHAAGRHAERYRLNREILRTNFDLKDRGVSLDDLRTIGRQAQRAANRDFATGADPFVLTRAG